MSAPRFSHTITRIGHTIVVERLGISVTFYPQDKDRTLTALLLKLKEYGDDITGDDPASRSEKQNLDRQLTGIYVAWEAEITGRKITLPERLAAQVNARLVDKWMDYEGRHFVSMEKGEHLHTFNMDSEEFGKEVSNIAFRDLKELVTNEKRDLAIRHLKDNTTKRRQMYNRVAYVDGAIYYDLHTENWQAIKITSEGWHIIENPLFFRRESNNPILYAAPIPNRDYPRGRHFLRELVNMMSIKYDHQRHILEVVPLSFYINNIAHPVMLPFGPAGAGKSTLLRIIRMCIDPVRDSDGLLESMPKDPKDRRVDVVGNYVTFWDNISHLDREEMDEICRFTTGTKIVVRVLHTTDDRREYVVKRIVGLSGINIPVSQSDALNRGFIIEMANIDRNKISADGESNTFSEFTDSERMAHIRAMLPDVYGYMMDVLVKTLQLYKAESASIKPNHRLDDFVVWGECISRALGYNPGEFLKAWETNVQTQKYAVIENNSFASLFVRYIFNSHLKDQKITMEPLEMYTEFVAYANSIGVDYHADKNLPKSSSWFSNRLAEIQNDLSIAGITIDFNRNAAERSIIVTKDLHTHKEYMETSAKRDQAEKKAQDEKIVSQEEKDQNDAFALFKQYCNENQVRKVIPSTFQAYIVSQMTVDTGRAHYAMEKLVQRGRLAYDDENNLVIGPKGEHEQEVQG